MRSTLIPLSASVLVPVTRTERESERERKGMRKIGQS